MLFVSFAILVHFNVAVLVIKVTLMEYKPVWPASGRDFCTFWHLKRIDESVVCFACEAVGFSFSSVLAFAFYIINNETDCFH